ncbi:iron uptake system component EfeO [Brevibacterium pityocampae]
MILSSRPHRALAVKSCAAAALLALTGCEANDTATDDGLTVSAADDSCEVSSDTAASGTTTFEITNDGSIVTEFYLLGDDGLRIVAEQENIAPGATATLTASLQPGDYFTACKPGLRGANVGEAAFTVTGEAVELTGEDQELFDTVVADYVDFVKNEIAALNPEVEKFAQAYMDGDDETARELYAPTRIHYERIEPIAEALGTLDPRIDYREVDYLAEAEELEADDPEFTEWTGFHRIEKDLFPPQQGDRNADGSDAFEQWEESTLEDRQRLGQRLIEDVQTLYDTVHSESFVSDQQMNISTVSNGATGLLEEVAVTKVTGEENWWSHYDLWDFKANVEGSRVAFDLVAPIAERKGEDGAALVEEITGEYDELDELLAEYGSYEAGFTMYDEVSAEQQAELTRQIDELREPLSRLTGTVLGIEE